MLEKSKKDMKIKVIVLKLVLENKMLKHYVYAPQQD